MRGSRAWIKSRSNRKKTLLTKIADSKSCEVSFTSQDFFATIPFRKANHSAIALQTLVYYHKGLTIV